MDLDCMKTVAEAIEELKKFSPEAYVYAYEGEMQGLVIIDKKQEELGTVNLPYERLNK